MFSLTNQFGMQVLFIKVFEIRFGDLLFRSIADTKSYGCDVLFFVLSWEGKRPKPPEGLLHYWPKEREG